MPSAGSAKASHAIRNALNVIIGSAQLLQGPDPLTPKQVKYVDRILQASREILAAIEIQSEPSDTRHHGRP